MATALLRSFMLTSILILSTKCNCVKACCVNITVAVLLERSAIVDFPFQINRTIGLIEIAINKSRDMLQRSAHLEFIIRYADVPTCTALEWGALAADIYHNNEIHAIIGPGCTPSVETVSRMAVKWNLPHITYVGTAESLGNKKEFRMLSRLSFTMNVFAKFYMEVFKAFQWTDIANLYDSSEYLPRLVGTSLQRSFLEANVLAYELPFQTHAADLHTELLRVLREAMKVSRVFLVSCHGDTFRQMVLLAQHLGMEAGEYTFIFFFQLVGDPPVGEYTWERNDELDREAKRAYESVMVIRPRRPTTEEFYNFEEEAKRRALLLYDYRWPEGSELSIYNIGHYDSFILYALALNDTLAAGEDPRDGARVVQRMWNRTFPGIGGMVYINENGDRDTDFTLLNMEPGTGNWRVVAQYLGYTHTFELLSDFPIHWPNDHGPPPNRPRCGYIGELCRSYSLPLYASVAMALGGVILVVVAAGAFAYRRMKAEAAIHSQWWRVKWEEVSMQTKSSFYSSCSKLGDGASGSVATHTAAFQTIGIYKGTQVHIRKPKIKSLTVDRKLLMELKQMRDVTCPNLTRLIGVCPEANNVCIITEYCSRGSLQDILQNESIQLDWDFRISLINDVVQGLYYIHTSPIEVHGRLTSSRCVIDGRFVLKITGFGLKSVNDCNVVKNKQQNNPYAFFPELLWMAPEILRRYPPRIASQPGDIYSFAIILYEMCTRNEPFVTESWYQSLECTVEELKKGGLSPLRPSFGEHNSSFPEIYKLTEDCWSEKPEDRPTIGLARKTVFSLRRGNIHGKNVLDALLHRMEQYANNLEGLVEERTNAFLEEKKKSEELLYQVLPKSVASQLRSGQAVVPEAFESVTVYFSDIVGFTNISAVSTPFQVVDFLNDLYICFDRIIDNFDVYKVETIGDAYMVVSGLPVRNENEHVRQIAQMSLSILEHVRKFTIRHQPETPLRARIGVHTGSVCAGVVGRKMPRYCLFGDTVNTASRMESNGEAMKIHISDPTKQLLDVFGTFLTERRGHIDIKGKGSMLTHWLIGEIQSADPFA